MADKIHINTFEGGLNKDLDRKKLNPNSYRDAFNVELIGNGSHGALRNIAGSTPVIEILNATNDSIPNDIYTYDYVSVLGVFDSEYYVTANSELEKCLTIFLVRKDSTKTNSYFEIFVYSLDSEILQKIYSESVTSSYYSNVNIDAFAFSENGVDSIYYTDGITEPKKIRCVLDGVVTKDDLELLRKYPRGSLDITNVIYTDYTTGGGGTNLYRYFSMDNIQTIDDTGPSGWRHVVYEDELILDVDTIQGIDSFKFDIHYLVNASYSAGAGKCQSQVWLYDRAGNVMSGFPVGIDVQAPLISGDSFSSDHQYKTITIGITDPAYDGTTPYKWKLEAYVDKDAGSYSTATIYLDISSTTTLAGENIYLGGSASRNVVLQHT